MEIDGKAESLKKLCRIPIPLVVKKFLVNAVHDLDNPALREREREGERKRRST